MCGAWWCWSQVAIRDGAFLAKVPWQCLIVDEGHRLKNSSSVLYKQLNEARKGEGGGGGGGGGDVNFKGIR